MARNFLEYESAIPVYRQYGHSFITIQLLSDNNIILQSSRTKKNQKVFGFLKNQYANSTS